ncbi:zinc finger protein 516-like isoform X1 [Phyllopteryx taeniolatus]|uniref:zinc finger protein 516-like isoform X1 n=1 Tax=Phyllopteryx taeniolatus TaxID=161469 RepID=UPI002AD3F137|nr:zinc finger protein 516-like isoform X1 [Phyllopteryx taeniolatus]XP_061616836.1 zinc finger protein 516-like isoform X1 [Phyllopteryx taeniolatus]XP_061616837.1 zinc finger protein 516-like isoform X1 [Phyllopteryx taeniolatus]
METKARREEEASPKDAETEEDATSGHTCGVCGRSFPLLSSLSQHMRRHTREKPYKCPYCDHRTAQKGTLKAHIRSHKLGLFGLSDQQAEEEIPDTPETVKKKPNKKKAKDLEPECLDAGPFSCSICAQDFAQAPLLKSHMKRHRSAQDHGCRICGRRFRQAWFLQSHMRIHRVKAQLRGGKSDEPPATVNGVPQDPAALANDECLYELCGNCGHFFTDSKTLRLHERLHRHSHNAPQDLEACQLTKNRFLESLNLTRVAPKEAQAERNLGRRIPELDPLCSYQAWQLATRGRLAEAGEKCIGWEERLADADVAYDTAKGEYVSAKPEKKRKPIDVPASSAKKKKGDTVLEQAAKAALDKKSCQKERILLNGLGQAFYEALQHRTIRDKEGSRNQEQDDEKPLLCEHCDFHTADASLLRAHVRAQHQDGKQSAASDNLAGQNSCKASKYVDYLRKRSALLCQPYWNPYPGLPGELNIKTETSSDGEARTGSSLGSLLNLSSLADNKGHDWVQKESLLRHQCPYCSHATCYPEVLWIHQRVSHRVGSGSSAAPKWAPFANGIRTPKTSPWRRTGPPPFLEGKDCPALPAPRSHRTQPPAGSSIKQAAAKSQSGAKSKPQAKDTKAPDSRGRVKSEQKRAAQSASKASSSGKSVSGRTATEGTFPKEGLGFMLSHGGASSDSARHRPRRLPSPSPKGADLWAAMSMWGHRAYFEPLLYPQAKPDAAVADPPPEFDVVSLLKSYSPHELAALYQHWGFVEPRLEPQAVLRLNGHFENEVHSSSEASKQVTSRSTSTSGSLHKGT